GATRAWPGSPRPGFGGPSTLADRGSGTCCRTSDTKTLSIDIDIDDTVAPVTVRVADLHPRLPLAGPALSPVKQNTAQRPRGYWRTPVDDRASQRTSAWEFLLGSDAACVHPR